MILWLAPMDGITDLPYRIITKRIFDKYNTNPENQLRLWTEFMTSDGYVANPHKVIKHLIHTEFEKPLILQIFGWKKEKLLATAIDLEKKFWIWKNWEIKIAWIELNTGCPSNTVMKNWWWSALLKDKIETLNIIKTLSEKLTVPFSIKTRTWLNEDDKKAQLDFLVKASKYCHMISVHARTLKELYTGDWDRDFIYKLKEEIAKTWNNCKVIWNWAIKYHEEINNKLNNLDWVMIWQAAIWNPRIFTSHKPSIQEKYKTIIEHFELMAKWEIFIKDIQLEELDWPRIYPKLKDIESINLKENYDKIYYTPLLFRKYLHQYLKWIVWSKDLKEQCNKTTNFKENIDYIKWFFKKRA